ncbi:ATP-binding protein [Streptomyces sp. CB03234]|uniref:ATP-binding protein n=1 Tax=Streptomyces sp. (strain CB03234) TaxID=1703937 RepID=UPI00093C97DF|nr:ATP-binding protein [Streptomyces sp. CB03234]OKK06298.1 ATP-binding protein [Streptomyces sp. CB03234]
MSLPLTRRIARAALLIAAGAAPVVGAAGSASAVDLSKGPELGGVSSLDTASATGTVSGASESTTGLVGEAGSKAVKQAVPAAGKTVAKTGEATTPVAQKAAGDAAGNAGELVGGAAGAAPTDALGGGVPAELPVKTLPALGQ